MRLLGAVVLSFSLLIGAMSASHSGPIQYNWFYRFVVDLVHGDEPISIDVVIACGSESRQILGEGRSVRAIRAPYIYGVRITEGHGVLVQTPDICDRDLAKDPVPPDYLPIVFWAPKADDLEFLIAYLHESAYEQPISKLKFVRATVSDATRRDYEDWRATKWKDNIVPIGDRADDQIRGISYFRGEGFFPRGDVRNQPLLRMSCHSFIKLPMPDEARQVLRAHWPKDHPRYWLLEWRISESLLTKHWVSIRNKTARRDLGTLEDISSGRTLFIGTGLLRSTGVGHLAKYSSEWVAGKALRIPYRVDTGFPWASDRLLSQRTIDFHADTDGGADHGFAYCYRNVFRRYFYDPKTRSIRPADQRVFVNDDLIGVLPHVTGSSLGGSIVERDEYIWRPVGFPLTYELGRMQ